MNQSRLIHYNRSRLPRQKRTIRLFGATAYIDGRVVDDQSDRIFKCWNCGFICDTSKNKLGDGVGFTVQDKVDKTPFDMAAAANRYPCSNASEMAMTISMEEISTPLLMKLDTEGNPVTVMHNLTQVVTSGCPLCGSKAYK
jgi:hypothetical protein